MAEFVTRITSLNNPRIKNVIRLNNRRQRDARSLTVVEGQREAARALRAGVVPQEAYICPALVARSDDGNVSGSLRRLAQAGATQLFEVTSLVFEKMAYRGGSGGILLVIPYLNYTFDDLSGTKNPFLVVIDGVEKPGNLGAILRTADAAGVDGLILTGDEATGTDIHNPNVIRASLGAIFTVPVIPALVSDAATWLRGQGIRIIATTPEADEAYTAVPLTGPIAIVLGSEAFGLGDDWLRSADLQVRIPMHGVVDSLNLSVSTALLLYEVVRQRS
jgi:TrmH family RNA methyltransferase